MQLITNDLVALDADLGATKDAVIASLAQLVADAGRADAAGLTADDASANAAMVGLVRAYGGLDEG